ncbi:MAG: hypothetical protein C4532_01205 [Candidatus Abyssobacteria bacterium SURF_17]|uniref:Uncharacterized protein n=1 Tax=Candidatus Abyssobacteria bacterium SURF_17 TaxID=2093361 RepID=A0A419F8U4_9BACT|nr:MAG: hypothetical protein C4532_01205 [Candidatus Abyssubacteria bacterium SURF_17]
MYKCSIATGVELHFQRAYIPRFNKLNPSLSRVPYGPLSNHDHGTIPTEYTAHAARMKQRNAPSLKIKAAHNII